MSRCTNKVRGLQCLKNATLGDAMCSGECRFPGESDGFQTVHSTKPQEPAMPNVTYYVGRGGLEARDVVASFELGYNVGTAVVYALRAGKKPGNTFASDIEKAINHLRFALEDSTKG